MGENKHNKEDLKQMQSLPLDVKIRMTKRRIEEWHDHWNENGGGTYVSFSGGKDSTVLKHIVDSMYDDVPSVFVDTGLEYPEIKAFVREINEGKYEPRFKANVEIIRPKMRFDEVIKTEGYPVISKEVADVVRGTRIYLSDLKAERDKIRGHYEIEKLYGIGRYAERERERESLPVSLDIPTTTEELKAWENTPKRVLKLLGMLGKGNQPVLSTTPNNDRSMYSCTKYQYLLDAPFLISRKCCDIMKKRPAHKYQKESGRVPFIGTMADESNMRKQAWIRTGCNAFESTQPHSTPLAFWTEQDVYEYIVLNNLPIAKVYGDVIKNDKDVYETTGVDRTGCMFCMFGAHLEKEPNRFQRMKETHPKQYEYCMKDVEDGGLGLRKVLEFIGVPYE